MALTETERALVVAGIAASATLVAATIAATAAYLASKRERRRLLYGEAFKAALGWHEMLYRVRRRRTDNEGELVETFHELQERLTYYQGWIASESRYMERSYKRLVAAVKGGTEPLIRQAWESPVRPVPGNALPADEHPTFDAESSRFLQDVRSFLSPLYFRKLAVVWRNSGKRAVPATPTPITPVPPTPPADDTQGSDE